MTQSGVEFHKAGPGVKLSKAILHILLRVSQEPGAVLQWYAIQSVETTTYQLIVFYAITQLGGTSAECRCHSNNRSIIDREISHVQNGCLSRKNVEQLIILAACLGGGKIVMLY